jgi:hypothetical protein
VTKINTDAMINGDHPLRTVVSVCRVAIVFDTPIGSTTGGFQTFRNATITSSEKTADTMSTRPDS